MPEGSRHRALMRPRAKAWHERDGGRRLAHDLAIIATPYPNLKHYIDGATGKARLEGSITLVAACGVPTLISVRIEFPTNYPSTEPRAYDAAGRFPHDMDHHFYTDSGGRCCLWLPPETRWDYSYPDALSQFLDEVAIFFDRQLIYEASGQRAWPGGQRSHGDKGYLEYIIDFFNADLALVTSLAPVLARPYSVGRNEHCPCGSGRKYKHCHIRGVETLHSKIADTEMLERISRPLVTEGSQFSSE